MKHFCSALLLFSLCASGQAFDNAKLDAFIDEVSTRHSLQRAWTSNLLYQAEKKQSILDAISRPAERARPWHEYRALFINEQRIRDGVRFWNKHNEILRQVELECGVPVAVIVAILGIETQYGTRTGRYRVIDALSTLAFEYPPRSDFFRDELEQFLLLVNEHDIDPLQALGSYAGAMGAAQFISSSYRNYAVDSSGDGKINLWTDWRDVIGSVANYLHHFGWQPNQPAVDPIAIDNKLAQQLIGEKLALNWTVDTLRQKNVRIGDNIPDDLAAMVFSLEHDDGERHYVGYNNFYVITRYNRSRMYAMAVLDLGREISNRIDSQ